MDFIYPFVYVSTERMSAVRTASAHCPPAKSEELVVIRNTAPYIPVGAEKQLQWLVDRAAIADLLTAFARALDAGDWAAYGSLMADDVVFSFGDHVVAEGRDAFVKDATTSMTRYHGTWHVTGHPGIEIDGDVARSKSYSMGVHRLGAEDTGRTSTGAGWYDCEFRREEAGWLFTAVRLTILWTAGEDARPA